MLLLSSDVDFYRGTLGNKDDEDYENDEFFKPKPVDVRGRSRNAKPVTHFEDAYSYRKSDEPSKDPYFRDWVSASLWGKGMRGHMLTHQVAGCTCRTEPSTRTSHCPSLGVVAPLARSCTKVRAG
jgi:hypothetical protein